MQYVSHSSRNLLTILTVFIKSLELRKESRKYCSNFWNKQVFCWHGDSRFKGATKSYRKIISVSNTNQHNQHFKLLFFKLNLHFDTSKCRKSNLLLIDSIYLVVYSPKKERRLIQIKLHFKFFYSIRVKTTHKPWNVIAAKTFFLLCVCYRCSLFW